MQQKHAYQNFKDEELWYSQKGNQTIKNTTKVYATNIWQVVTWFSPSNMTKTYFAIKLGSFSAFNGDIANLPIWCFQRPKIYGRYLQLFSVPVAWPLPYIGLYKARLPPRILEIHGDLPKTPWISMRFDADQDTPWIPNPTFHDPKTHWINTILGLTTCCHILGQYLCISSP